MTNLKDLISKLLQTAREDRQLENQYKKKPRGRAYTKRKVLLMQRRKFYEQKVKAFGTTCNIIICRYRVKKQWYKIYLTDLELEDAKIVLQLAQPAATNCFFEEIQSGSPSLMD